LTISDFFEYIQQETLSTLVEKLDGADMEKEVEVGEYKVKFWIKR